MSPVLKARIGGAWVPVGGGTDEVWVGPTTPTDSATELWVTPGSGQMLTPTSTVYVTTPNTADQVLTQNFVITCRVKLNTVAGLQYVFSQSLQGSATARTVELNMALLAYSGVDHSLVLIVGAGSVSWRVPGASWALGADLWLRITVNVGATTATLESSLNGTTWTPGPASTTAAQPLTPANAGVPLSIGWGQSGLTPYEPYWFLGSIYWVQIAKVATPTVPVWRFDANELTDLSATAFTDKRGRAWTLKAAGAIVMPVPPALYADVTGLDVWTPITGNEVHVGTSDPGGATELWYDTDEPNLADPDTARWNSAWGVVASTIASSNFALTATNVALTSPLTFTMQIGRRYRIVFKARALGGTNVSAHITFANSSNLNVPVFADDYASTPVNYGGIYVEALENGTGQTYTLVPVGQASNNTPTIYPTLFYVEDVGPVSLASSPPAQPARVWTAPTLLNGWINIGSPHQVAQYRLLGDKVELRGRVISGSINMPIFNLPVGYRPLATTVFATAGVVGGQWTMAELECTTDGNVTSFGPGANTNIVFNGLSFSVTA